jgi:hypothetical protein
MELKNRNSLNTSEFTLNLSLWRKRYGHYTEENHDRRIFNITLSWEFIKSA